MNQTRTLSHPLLVAVVAALVAGGFAIAAAVIQRQGSPVPDPQVVAATERPLGGPAPPAPQPETSPSTSLEPSPESDVPPTALGRWRGQIIEPKGSDGRYAMDLVIGPGIIGSAPASARYPSFRCESQLRLENVTAAKMEFTERLVTNDTGKCDDGLTIFIEVKSSSELALRLYYDGDAADEGVPDAYGALRR